MQPKIQHNHTCEVCGKPATINEEDITVTYEVLPDDDYKKLAEDFIDGSSRYFCDDHYTR